MATWAGLVHLPAAVVNLKKGKTDGAWAGRYNYHARPHPIRRPPSESTNGSQSHYTPPRIIHLLCTALQSQSTTSTAPSHTSPKPSTSTNSRIPSTLRTASTTPPCSPAAHGNCLHPRPTLAS